MAILRERIAERYPDLLPLLSIPEVASLLRQAVDPNSPMSETSFQSKLRATKWFRGQSESQRQWFITAQSDPGEAKQVRDSYAAELAKAAAQYGVILSKNQLVWLREVGIQRGWEANGTQMMYELSKLRGSSNDTAGALRTTARSVQEAARRDYFYVMSNKNAAKWADWIVRGVRTEEDMRATVMERSKSMFPQFATGLQQGYTMAELTDGQREIIARELELDPERIDFARSRWSKVLGVKDSKGKVRPMTMFETLQHVRKDPRWWKTQHGKQTDAEWSRNILAMFGKRAPMGGGVGGQTT